MTILPDPRQNPIIIKAIEDSHQYQMEYKHHQNHLLYILLKLHGLGGRFFFFCLFAKKETHLYLF